MKELSLHILDIAQNSITAEATRVDISVVERAGTRTMAVRDDGRGMPETLLRSVQDPFTTTRTTRPVGLGIPLLRLAAEQAGGGLRIDSRQGEGHGTELEATFEVENIDCVPLGDLSATMVTLIHGNPQLDFTLEYETAAGRKWLSTVELRETLEGVPLETPEVLAWIGEYIREPFE